MWPSFSIAAFSWVVIGLNLALVARHFVDLKPPGQRHDTGSKEQEAREYSYIGPDYPETLPIPISKAAMTFQPSFHYRITPTNRTSPFSSSSSASLSSRSTEEEGGVEEVEEDPPMADEWLSTYSSDLTFLGGYFVRLGPSYRTFELAIFHQLHCLSTLHKVFLYPNLDVFGPEHVGHCLNYLRQHFLCEADDTLEPGDFMQDVMADGEGGRLGGAGTFERECRDWGTVFEFAKENLGEFRRYRDIERGSLGT